MCLKYFIGLFYLAVLKGEVIDDDEDSNEEEDYYSNKKDPFTILTKS